MFFKFCNFVSANYFTFFIMKTLVRISFLIIAALVLSCSSNKPQVLDVVGASRPSSVIVGNGVNQNQAIPKAVIYRTNGDYIDNVPVNMNARHTSLVSFPAPTDITSRSTPVELGDGWLFDRRGGVNANTVFLSYTYSEYAALGSTPSASALLQAIIPGSAVTQCVVTPVTLNEAMVHPEILKQYIPR